MGLGIAAALWSAAEATLFFVVVDVLLTFAALRHGPRPALIGCLWATGGALLGGAAMYQWAAADPVAAHAAVAAVPAISQAMIDQAREALDAEGLAVVVVAGITGVPYKIHAVLAPQAGIGLAAFLLASAPARLLRFAGSVLIAAGIDRLLARSLPRRGRLAVLAVFWLVFYAGYLAFVGRG